MTKSTLQWSILLAASHYGFRFQELPAAGSRNHPNGKPELGRLTSHARMIDFPVLPGSTSPMALVGSV